MKTTFAAAVALATLGLAAATSRASFVANLTTASTAVNQYAYSLDLVITQNAETLYPGDSITLYDVAPAADILNVSSVPGFTTSIANTGVTPAALVGAAGLHDDPTLANITFTYAPNPSLPLPPPLIGGGIGYDYMLGTTIITMAPAYTSARIGQAASSSTVEYPPLVSPDLFQGDQSGIYVEVLPAAVPEPASLSLLALAAPALLKRRRR